MMGHRQPPVTPPTAVNGVSTPTPTNGASEVSVTNAGKAEGNVSESRPISLDRNALQPDETRPEMQNLEPVQSAALRYFLEGGRLGAVAAAVGVDRTTLWRWLRTPEWRMAVAQERQLLQTAIRAQLLALAAEATQVLDSTLRGPDKRLALRAALAVLQGVGALPGRDNGGFDSAPDSDSL